MPRATASTASVKSSREPVAVTRISNQGTTRVPTTRASATNTAIFASTSATAIAMLSPPATPSGCTSTGRITTASTIATSSTISQPIAM